MERLPQIVLSARYHAMDGIGWLISKTEEILWVLNHALYGLVKSLIVLVKSGDCGMSKQQYVPSSFFRSIHEVYESILHILRSYVHKTNNCIYTTYNDKSMISKQY